jgi:hypothetical protein
MKHLLLCGWPVPVVAASFVFAAYAQSPANDFSPTFKNLSFAEGAPGSTPPGWYLGPEWFLAPHVPVYKAEIAAGPTCKSGGQCAVVSSLREDSSIRLAFLYQNVDAKPYRRQILTFRAAVRAEVALGGVARLLVRIRRDNGDTSFRDDMGNHPITSDGWAVYEIRAPLVLVALEIVFGLQLVGQGAAWIDSISIVSVRRIPVERVGKGC